MYWKLSTSQKISLTLESIWKMSGQPYHSDLLSDITLSSAIKIDSHLRSILALCEMSPGAWKQKTQSATKVSWLVVRIQCKQSNQAKLGMHGKPWHLLFASAGMLFHAHCASLAWFLFLFVPTMSHMAPITDYGYRLRSLSKVSGLTPAADFTKSKDSSYLELGRSNST